MGVHHRWRCTVIGLLCCAAAQATEIVYTPINPSFGGSPFNAATLLNSAQATTKHQDPNAASTLSYFDLTPLQQFNQNLERSVLNQLSSAATSGIIVGGKMVPGAVETGNFRIVITDVGGGMLRISTTDKGSGATTSFEVNSQ